MKTIQLHGILAKKFGKFFRLKVQTAREATHALACQIPAFRQFMLDSEKHGYRFAVFTGKVSKANNIGENRLDFITDKNTIHIVPKVIGSGGKAMAWLQVVAGVALIGVGLFNSNPALIGAGVGLLLGGVSTLLMPTPPLGTQDEDGNRANNGFGGAVTTVAQGNPVPVLYGEREVGGFVASASIIAEDKVVAGVDAPRARLGVFRR
ncbi:tail assembly protein [Moraxella sp. ZJ142]|uniref:tail assembly protein n=1 Tax=Moraxella marmotae TaxID=3344520 RepID=UPI0035D4B9A7